MVLPREVLHLRQIADALDDFFGGMPVVRGVALMEFYAFLRRRGEFREWCFSGAQFSRFLRMYHENGMLRQFVCYEVDTSYYKWTWTFRPKVKPVGGVYEGKVHASAAGNFHRENMVFEAANGVRVRSGQEQYILNKLLTHRHLEVWYERALVAGGQERYPDFTILNKNTDTVFYWEHFGLSENEGYAEIMAEKIAWYDRIGIHGIDRGGRFIGTIFVDRRHFVKLVDDLIRDMDKIVVPTGFMLGL